MKPRLDPRRLPAAAGERYRHARGVALVSPARLSVRDGGGQRLRGLHAHRFVVAVAVMRNRFAAGDLTTAALIDRIVARALT